MIDNTKVQKGLKLKKGEIIFIQEQSVKSLNILHKGVINLFRVETSVNNLKPEQIINMSSYVDSIQGEAFFGETELLSNKPYSISAVAASDIIISIQPVKYGTLPAMLKSNPGFGIKLLTGLDKKIIGLATGLSKINNLYKLLEKLKDSIFIQLFKSNFSSQDKVLQKKIEDINNTPFIKSSAFGEPIQANDFRRDYSKELNKEYGIVDFSATKYIDMEKYNFAHSILKVDTKIISALISSSAVIPNFLFKNFSKIVENVRHAKQELMNNIQVEIMELLGYNGLIDVLYNFIEDENSRLHSMKEPIKGIIKSQINAIIAEYEKIFHTKLTGITKTVQILNGADTELRAEEDYDDILDFIDEEENADENHVEDDSALFHLSADAQIPNEIRGSLNTILKFADLGIEFESDFIKALSEFRNIENKTDSSTELRKLRRNLTRGYWNIYKTCYKKSLAYNQSPLSVKLLLRFGLLDDTLLEERDLTVLANVPLELSKARYQIHTSEDWLKIIHDKIEEPSITELGQTYKKYLIELERNLSRKERLNKKELSEEEEKLRRVDFEIDQLFKSTVRVLSGSPSTAVPFLCSELIPGNLEKMFVSDMRIERIVSKILDIDFSCFYRETLFRAPNANRSEIILTETLPNIIVMPVAGERIMHWQELDGVRKDTRARIIVPSFFVGNIEKAFAKAFAAFRWEINRAIRGASWQDPVDGGLTGAYIDYIEFYKKNSDLSREAKEKLREHIRKFRDNRSRFAEDYYNWVIYESQGILRLNKVVRNMFYRYIPFKKHIRDFLEKQPAYNQIAVRFKNIMNRELRKQEIRFRKFQDANGNYPPELLKYLNYYKI